jgi:CubicO group peptidase (beta-lactamase class C family)
MADVASAAPELHELEAWSPTILVRSAGQSSVAAASSEQVIYAASVAKQFTAFLAALLVIEGWWTDAVRIRALLPELPSWAERIELQHLVHHSSGLPSTQRMRESGVEWPSAWSNSEILAAIVHHLVPVREPGLACEYCNLGYILIAIAIERVVNRPFAEIARERLFEPAGMAASQFGGPPPRARITETEPATIGDGGLWTTPADLERWNQAMNARDFGSAAHDLAERPGCLRNGSLIANGWGVGIVEFHQRVFFHKGGSVEGWTTKVARERTSGTSVVLATKGAPAELVHDTAMKIAADASTS